MAILPYAEVRRFVEREPMEELSPSGAGFHGWRSVGAVVRPFRWRPVFRRRGSFNEPMGPPEQPFFPEAREGEASGHVCARVRGLLTIAKGLYPDRFCEVEPPLAVFGVAYGTATVLLRLRAMAASELASLPTPVGFSHRKIVRIVRRERRQQPIVRDPSRNCDRFRDGQAG